MRRRYTTPRREVRYASSDSDNSSDGSSDTSSDSSLGRRYRRGATTHEQRHRLLLKAQARGIHKLHLDMRMFPTCTGSDCLFDAVYQSVADTWLEQIGRAHV